MTREPAPATETVASTDTPAPTTTETETPVSDGRRPVSPFTAHSTMSIFDPNA